MLCHWGLSAGWGLGIYHGLANVLEVVSGVGCILAKLCESVKLLLTFLEEVNGFFLPDSAEVGTERQS